MAGKATFVVGGLIGDQLAGIGIALAHERFRRGESDIAFFQRRSSGPVIDFTKAQGLFCNAYEIPTGGHTWRSWMLDWPWGPALMGHLMWATRSQAHDIIPATMSWHPDGPRSKCWGPGVIPPHVVARLVRRFPWCVDPFVLLHPWSVAGSCSLVHHWPHAAEGMAAAVSVLPLPSVLTGLGRVADIGATHNLIDQLSFMELAALVSLSSAVISTSNSCAFLAAIFDRPLIILGNKGWTTSPLKSFFCGTKTMSLLWTDPMSVYLRFLCALF